MRGGGSSAALLVSNSEGHCFPVGSTWLYPHLVLSITGLLVFETALPSCRPFQLLPGTCVAAIISAPSQYATWSAHTWRSRWLRSSSNPVSPITAFLLPTVAHLTPLALISLDRDHTGTVTDLVVVTLLRVNSASTKESLGKALFNLLARADFRSVPAAYRPLDVTSCLTL